MVCWKATFPSESDEFFMARAMELALRGRGPTAPNPTVGAVLVQDRRIVAEGWHTRYGAPHAERECLADAARKGVDPSGCTMYVTLEPCNHHGKTLPCTDAILEAGIRRVVIGSMDPNDEAAGGAARLLDNGVEIVAGVLEQECTDLIADFRVWKKTERTANILKIAQTLDGRIAARHGRPEAVSCPESFAEVQRIRSFVHAVVVGGNTFYADNPSLTCRAQGLPDDFTQPYAVVVSSRLPQPDADLFLLRERAEELIFFTTQDAAMSDLAEELSQMGVSIFGLPLVDEDTGEGGLDLCAGFELLRSELDCHLTLVEGGGTLALSMVEQGLADELVVFLAPRVLGDEQGKANFSSRGAVDMAQAMDLRLSGCEPSGRDLRLTYRPL